MSGKDRGEKQCSKELHRKTNTSQAAEIREGEKRGKKDHQNKKRKHLNSIVLQMEQDFKRNNPREAYMTVAFKKGYTLKSSVQE